MKKITKMLSVVLVACLACLSLAACGTTYKVTIEAKPEGVSAFTVKNGSTTLATGDKVDKDTELTIAWTLTGTHTAALWVNDSATTTNSGGKVKITKDTKIELKSTKIVADSTETVARDTTNYIEGLNHNNGGLSQYGMNDFWHASYVVTDGAPINKEDLKSYFGEFSYEGDSTSAWLRVFKIKAYNGGNVTNAHLYTYDDPDNAAVMYDVLKSTSVISGTDYVGYWGDFRGKDISTLDGDKESFYFAASTAGSYVVTMYAVEWEATEGEGTWSFVAGDVLASHSVLFIVT